MLRNHFQHPPQAGAFKSYAPGFSKDICQLRNHFQFCFNFDLQNCNLIFIMFSVCIHLNKETLKLVITEKVLFVVCNLPLVQWAWLFLGLLSYLKLLYLVDMPLVLYLWINFFFLLKEIYVVNCLLTLYSGLWWILFIFSFLNSFFPFYFQFQCCFLFLDWWLLCHSLLK